MDAPKANGTALDLGGIVRLFEIKVCPIVMREQGLEEDKRKKKKVGLRTFDETITKSRFLLLKTHPGGEARLLKEIKILKTRKRANLQRLGK